MVWTVVMIIGVVLMVVGVVFFAKGRSAPAGTTRLKVPGFEAEVPAPALAFVLFGVFMVVASAYQMSNQGPNRSRQDTETGKVNASAVALVPELPVVEQTSGKTGASEPAAEAVLPSKPQHAEEFDLNGDWDLTTNGQTVKVTFEGEDPSYAYVGYNGLGMAVEGGNLERDGRAVRITAVNALMNTQYSMKLKLVSADKMNGSASLPGLPSAVVTIERQ
jgi:hypothetical protein